jgi:hypothetical protein
VGERLVAEIWRLPNRKSSGNRVGESKPGGRSSEEDDVVEPTWAGDAEARGEVLAAPPLAAAGDAVARRRSSTISRGVWFELGI